MMPGQMNGLAKNMIVITSKVAALLSGLTALSCALPCAGGQADAAGWEQLTGKPFLVVIDRDTQSDAALHDRLNVYFRICLSSKP